MQSTSTSEAIINPSSPWAFLPPDVSTKLAIGIYFHVGALAVLIWDLLYHLRTDIQLGLRRRFGPATAAFFLSRISVFIYAFGRAILLTTPVKHCEKLQTAILPFLALSVACMTLIAYLRVCAVYGNHKGIIGIFGLLWAAVVVAVSLTVHNITAGTIGPTDYCVESVIKHQFVQSGPITILVFDTFIFAAMTYRFYSMYRNQSSTDCSMALKARQGFNVAVYGSSLPLFSKALLHECQFYYIVGPMTKISLIVCMYAIPGPNHLPFWVMLISSHLILVNIVTCAVFRNVKGMGGDVNGTQSGEGRIRGTNATNTAGQSSAHPGSQVLSDLRFQSSQCIGGNQLHHMVATLPTSDIPYEVSVKVDRITVRHDDSFFESISEQGEKEKVKDDM